MKTNKTIINYAILTAGAIAFDKIYSLFGHGVSSPWMSYMYLVFLVLGVGAFTVLRLFVPDLPAQQGYRLFYNTYNSGIAALVNGMVLTGIVEIAGGTSTIIPWFLYAGYGLIAGAVVLLLRTILYRQPAKAA